MVYYNMVSILFLFPGIISDLLFVATVTICNLEKERKRRGRLRLEEQDGAGWLETLDNLITR
jgi:hypothetical protein